jgi:hypothetical protein
VESLDCQQARRYRSKKSHNNQACVENARGYVHLNSSRHYVETLVKVTAKGISVAEIVPLGYGPTNPRTVNTDGTTEGEPSKRPIILQCPKCGSNRAGVLDPMALIARCADCNRTYAIKKWAPDPTDDQPVSKARPRPGGHKKAKSDTIPVPSFGPLAEYIEATIKGGPEALRAAEREANRLAKKYGIDFEAQWLLKTKWLEETTSLSRNGSMNGHRPTRLRVRAIIAWRARWLAVYAMGFSKMMACRKAHVGIHTVNFHLKNDPDFALQAEAAKAYAIDLLHTRCFQRALEGDIEPIHWQGVVVDYVRKFPERLQIEMLRAHMPNTFKTPGSGPVNIDTGDKILVMTEELRAKLIALHREEIMDAPVDTPEAKE